MNSDGTDVKDLTPGTHDVPPFSLGGPDDYAISPDSLELAFAMNTDANLATSTNSDIYTVPLDGRRAAQDHDQSGRRRRAAVFARRQVSGVPLAGARRIRKRPLASDGARARDGADDESFRHARPLGGELHVVARFDAAVFHGGGSRTHRRADDRRDRRRHPQHHFRRLEPGRRTVQLRRQFHDLHGAKRVAPGGDFSRVVDGRAGGSADTVERFAAGVIGRFTPLENFWVDSADDTRVNAFVVKPPGFSETRKYPVLFLIHGGPQGAWGETWSYRWNAQVFASAGYLVVMPNPRGSTGYGQKFIDEINGDWGGKVYDDIMAVADHVASLPYADADRMAAAGGSFGGYMIDWMLGHTTRFKAMVSHDGVFDLRSMAGATEELWFPLWEFKGMPWDNPEMYEKWSPSYYVKDFKTPTLVFHGELDYRVPLDQGLQLFTSLQMQKVPSKIVLFPDEGHWVLKPQNSVLWYTQFLDWIGEWVKKPGN